MPVGDTDARSLAKATKWHQPCWAICGSCDYLGWGSCTMATTCPCAAQGLNRHAAHGSRCWSWYIVFFILLMPIYLLPVGRMTKSYCIEQASQEGHIVDSHDWKIIRVDHFCATSERFSVVTMAICIAAVVLGWFAWASVGWINRMHIRSKYNLPGNCCTDMLMWLFCPCCSLCQETRTIFRHSLQDILRGPLPTSSGAQPARRHSRSDSVDDLPL